MRQTLRQTNRQFMSVTIAICAAGLLIVAVWGWYLIRSIADPIRRVVGYAEMIAAGDLSMIFRLTGRMKPDSYWLPSKP